MNPSTELVVAPVEGQVVEGRTIGELRDEANRQHGLVLEAGLSVLEHAFRAGEALIAIRSRIPAGKWREWLAENYDGSPISAIKYMRLAHHQDLVRAEGLRTGQEAMGYLRGLTGPHPRGHEGHDDEIKEEARRLKAQGLSYRKIGSLLGVAPQTTHAWCDPKFAEKQRVANRKRGNEAYERRRLAEEQARNAAIKRAVRKAGEATKEAYAMAERLQDVLAQAQHETEDREARRALSEAGVHYRKMRDEIVRALGADLVPGRNRRRGRSENWANQWTK